VERVKSSASSALTSIGLPKGQKNKTGSVYAQSIGSEGGRWGRAHPLSSRDWLRGVLIEGEEGYREARGIGTAGK